MKRASRAIASSQFTMGTPRHRKYTAEEFSNQARSTHVNASSASNSTTTNSTFATIIYILCQIFEVPATAILLGIGFILPELKDTITSFGMGKTFDPERDIGSLEGKVILVTGGTHLTNPQPLEAST
jgi:hypothetical protein